MRLFTRKNKLLYSMVCNIPAAIFAWPSSEEDTLFFSDANEEACRILGTTATGITSIQVSSVFSDIKRLMTPLCQSRSLLRNNYSLLSRNGTQLSGNLKLFIFPAKIEYVIAFFQPSSSREQHPIYSDENTFRQLFDNLKSGIAIFQPVNGGNDFSYLDINSAGEQICHINRDQVRGKLITRVLPNICEFGFLEVLKQVFVTGTDEFFPLQMYSDSQMQFWIENYVFKLPSGYLVAIFDDTSEQRMAEEELQLMFSLSRDMICIVDPANFRYLKINGSFERILGYTDEEFLATSFLDFIHPDDVENTRTFMNQTVKKGQYVAHFENRYRTKSGEYRWFEWSSVPMPGRDVSYAIAHDITARKQTMETLKKTILEKDTLLKELYHRTKNNMQIISSMLTLQSMTSTSQEVHQVVHETQDRIQAIALVHQMLYKSGNLSEVDLRLYVSELVSLIAQSNHHVTYNVTINQEIDPIALLIDISIPCGLVLNEMLTNSFKYAFPDNRKGSITIKIKKNEERICFEYSDDGVGLPANFDISTSRSIGMQTIYTIAAHQLKAELSLVNGPGLKYLIEFNGNIYKARV